MSTSRSEFLDKVRFELGAVRQINRSQIKTICDKYDLPFPTWLRKDPTRQISRGVYALTEHGAESSPQVAQKVAPAAKAPVTKVSPAPAVKVAMVAPSVVATNAEVSLVPEKAAGYVPFGHFNDVRSIIKSKKFYPTYITGLSGNGKTMMIEQICAAEKREMVRVNVTIETDEDDLIGGFRLVNGETVWQDGPVITAMSRGAVLLLDEVDLGSNKLMCLQPVLEGKSVYLKKTNRVVTPATGFNVIATANTKGKGSDDGRFIGTNVMNEAFLERFSITMEQEYPATKVESKILSNVLGSSGIENPEFVDKLVTWADVIRKSFYEGALSEIISTRRLVHICEAFAIFNQNKMKAIELCLNRFDVDTKNSFLELYKKVDETVEPIGATGATGATGSIEADAPIGYVF
jgi:AAA domain (dynein-related subfamily)/CbbQ/NirQ/NorQ C-terminal